MPLHGRLWLPPDCESAYVLADKLFRYHIREARAKHRGAKHIEQHMKLAKKADSALGAIFAASTKS